jgi:4-aminobutyrate aminotransferase
MIIINDRIRKIIARDKKVMFTTSREHYPFVVERASGDYAYDIAGNRFIDFSSFIGVYTLGDNANEEIRQAVKRQVDKLMHPAFLDFFSEMPVRFAEKLVGMFPKGFGRVFFSNSGAEANEDGIKLARIFTRRQYLLSFYNSFHGRTLGALGLTASKAIQRKHFGPMPNVIHVPYPYPYRCPFNTDSAEECADACIDYIESNVFAKEAAPDEIAAIFIEPVQGEGGYIVPPKRFMQKLRKLTSDNGIMLVDDEIQAGYMRTGKFLALDNFGVDADIYTMAKALGGGVPIGATIARRSLGDSKPGEHAGTFGGNLLAIAAAEASLDYVNKNMKMLQDAVKTKGEFVMDRLREMMDDYDIIGDVRGIGLMIGMEFVKDKRSKEPAVAEREKIVDGCFRNGLLLLPAGVSTIRIIPPITMSMENMEKGMDVLEKVIKSTAKAR